MLRDFQSTFRSGILHEKGLDGPWSEQLEALVRERGIAPPDRLNVYRNNTLSLLGGLLELMFPVVRRLIGDAPFAYTVQNFIRAHPPTDRVLHKYGAAFAAFLEEFEPAQSLKYLPDVAAMEWALHEVFYERDAVPISLEALSSIAPEKIIGLRFELHPAVRFISSAYPINEIWRVNQPEFETVPFVNLNSGGCSILIARPEYAVHHETLSSAAYGFAQELADGKSLGEALEHVSVEYPTFELQQCLAQLFSMGVFARVIESE